MFEVGNTSLLGRLQKPQHHFYVSSFPHLPQTPPTLPPTLYCATQLHATTLPHTHTPPAGLPRKEHNGNFESILVSNIFPQEFASGCSLRVPYLPSMPCSFRLLGIYPGAMPFTAIPILIHSLESAFDLFGGRVRGYCQAILE